MTLSIVSSIHDRAKANVMLRLDGILVTCVAHLSLLARLVLIEDVFTFVLVVIVLV